MEREERRRAEPCGATSELLAEFQAGDRAALGVLFERLGPSIAALARHALRRERPGNTLNPADLVQEVYLKLAPQLRAALTSREHFLAVAALQVRRVLRDRARKRRFGRESLRTSIAEPDGVKPLDLEALDHALEALAQVDARQARIVELKFFGAMTGDEVARALGLSPRTVDEEWRLARGWLLRRLS